MFTAALLSQDMEMSIDRWMDKEDVVHKCNGISLSHKKEWSNAIRSNMDGPRDCCTEWRKSERERQISYNVAHMWNLEKCHRWTYLQAEIESQMYKTNLWLPKGELTGGGTNWETGIDIYTHWDCTQNRSLMRSYRIAQGTLLNALWWPKWKGNLKQRSVYIYFIYIYICIYLIHFAVQQKLTQHCKAIILQ